MITDRQNSLLDFIIGEYVKTARPVPSSSIFRKSRLQISPATIRNEMNRLEEMGYLSQFHTSGGRVPTDKAYRYFVNKLLNTGEIATVEKDRQHIRQAITKGGGDARLVNKNIAQTLSDLSGHLVITGMEDQKDFFKIGLASLFGMPEFREFNRMFQMTSFFEEFDQIFEQIERQFFDPIRRQKQFNVVIGHENPFSQIRDETVIVAKYALPSGFVGSVTLIGPTRMDYKKNIALIKCATEELNNKLT